MFLQHKRHKNSLISSLAFISYMFRSTVVHKSVRTTKQPLLQHLLCRPECLKNKPRWTNSNILILVQDILLCLQYINKINYTSEYKRNWIQHVNRLPRNRLPKVMKQYSPTGRRNHGRPLKRLLDG